MTENEVLLAAFLAEPHHPATRLAYIARLEQRGDPRGEYLRLLTGLDEPTDPDAGGPARQRLRELRGQIADAWACKVDCTLLATGGVYQSDLVQDAWEYLRFYPDRRVLTVGSAESPVDVWQRFNQEPAHGAFGHAYYRLCADQLSFSMDQEPTDALRGVFQARYDKLVREEVTEPYERGDERFDFIGADVEIRRLYGQIEADLKRVTYTGSVGPGVLCLRWHRHLDGSEGARTYRFVAALPERPTENVEKSQSEHAHVTPQAVRGAQTTEANPAKSRLIRMPGSPIPHATIRVTRWQNDSPPLDRRIGVLIGRAWEKAVISAAEACRLASFLEPEDPDSAARLREAAGAVKREAGTFRSDPGDVIDEADDTPAATGLARRLLGLDQPEA